MPQPPDFGLIVHFLMYFLPPLSAGLLSRFQKSNNKLAADIKAFSMYCTKGQQHLTRQVCRMLGY